MNGLGVRVGVIEVRIRLDAGSDVTWNLWNFGAMPCQSTTPS
jgi:hypothetical protein